MIIVVVLGISTHASNNSNHNYIVERYASNSKRNTSNTDNPSHHSSRDNRNIGHMLHTYVDYNLKTTT